jgi:hypothetical protein
MVVSFLMLYAGTFVALHALLVRLMSWLLESGWSRLVAGPLAVVILMMNLN